MRTTAPAQRLAGIALGVVLLALLLLLAVFLPKAEGDTGPASLPSTLPGGWTATDALEPSDVPDQAPEDAADVIRRQGDQREYVEKAYAEVYDEAPAFRVYADETLQQVALVTVFDGASGAFGPAQGIVDPAAVGLERAPTELVREGDAVCAVEYEPVAAGEESGEPRAVTCQQPAGERTVQVGAQGTSVDDTLALLDELVTEVG